MITLTVHTQKKLETLLESLDYKVRYEKGSFQSGYCLVRNRKIAVINKFFATEARVNSLIEIISTIEIDDTLIAQITEVDEKQGKLLKEIRKKAVATIAENTTVATATDLPNE